MSINPMELLKQKVSSVIVSEQTSLMNEKNAVLSKFYPILLARFLAKPELIEKLKDKLAPAVIDVVDQNPQVKNALLIRLAGGQMSIAETEMILNRAIPKSLAALSNETGNNIFDLIQYLRQHDESINALLPVWTDEVLSPLTFIKLKHSKPIPVPEVMAKQQRNPPVFPLLAFVAVGFSLLWLYQLIR